ncbi:MAG: pilus assembly protein PilP [Deltaproteobacteria bacterium]|nr:pilus assembly protein PilP [Deltaproteobacteria bacterium]
MRITHYPAVLISLAVLGVAACGEDEEAAAGAAPGAADAPKADEPGAAAPAEAEKQEELSYTYNAMNRRDPFKTYFDELSQNEQADQSNLTELQKIDLDKLHLVAVVVGTATPMAMVEDTAGRGHTVKIGTLIGKRLGQVKHIRRGEIVVQEEFRDFTGKRIPQLKELKLEESVASAPK